MRKSILSILIFFTGIFHLSSNPFLPVNIPGQTHGGYVSEFKTTNCFVLAENGKVAPVLIAVNEFPGVARVAGYFQNDILAITGVKPEIFKGAISGHTHVIIAGTIGQSSIIDELIRSGKINVDDVRGKREISLKQVVNNPIPGVERAFVIAGSDKRGTIYGILDLSRNLGVSPWYWWADVPIQGRDAIYLASGRFITEEPKVRLRGIFINNEAPALSGWVHARYGRFNHNFYERVFELILRLKGNFLWPAMWGRAFYDDCPHNAPLADELGVVIGTTHHEPMGRAHIEWARYGSGPWDYTRNAPKLREFWREGVERKKNTETIITLGMRGDGDYAMTEEVEVRLLERIIHDQRSIISEVFGKPASQVPQIWALYKEVQYYYDKGMRVPDDVMILYANDNWGNVRMLPEPGAPRRSGGYGMYYHFDYVGGPRNYKWLNVRQVQRIWEQMNLTWQHGVNQLWLVNVGDIKPMEYPITFFLDMAWNPERFNANNLRYHTIAFANEQFGGHFAQESARLIDMYSKFNSRVTPELLNENTFSLHNYNEFARVNQDYKELLLDAFKTYYLMPEKYRDAFDQLVLFPIQGMSNLYEMYYAVARNRYLAGKNDPEANYWAEKARHHFLRDTLLTIHFNSVIADGKWRHMMDQARIGYTYWQQPRRSVMPRVNEVSATEPADSEMVFLEQDGFVSIEAVNFNRLRNPNNISWLVIPNMGRTYSAVTTSPANAYPTPQDQVYLEYDIYFESTGEFELSVLVSPTLNFNRNRGLRYAVSFNGGPEQIVNFNQTYTVNEMEHWQATSINKTTSKHQINRQGLNTLRVRALEPGIVFQKILIDTGGLKPTFLGAPESPRVLRKEIVEN
ncbi:MAG TPA: glycosyl hydrolase 115 family protein [Bacteroidales bacterium]|nr:glycosyl hydrolase 115 family protein [Bacteroidales bacterium]